MCTLIGVVPLKFFLPTSIETIWSVLMYVSSLSLYRAILQVYFTNTDLSTSVVFVALDVESVDGCSDNCVIPKVVLKYILECSELAFKVG